MSYIYTAQSRDGLKFATTRKYVLENWITGQDLTEVDENGEPILKFYRARDGRPAYITELHYSELTEHDPGEI